LYKEVPIDEFGGYSCLFFDDIQIDFIYKVTIFIPGGVNSSECKSALALGHQFEHHQVNLDKVSASIKSLEQYLPEVVREIEFKHRIDKSEITNYKINFGEKLKDFINIHIENLAQELKETTSEIDNPDFVVSMMSAMEACGTKSE